MYLLQYGDLLLLCIYLVVSTKVQGVYVFPLCSCGQGKLTVFHKNHHCALLSCESNPCARQFTSNDVWQSDSLLILQEVQAFCDVIPAVVSDITLSHSLVIITDWLSHMYFIVYNNQINISARIEPYNVCMIGC